MPEAFDLLSKKAASSGRGFSRQLATLLGAKGVSQDAMISAPGERDHVHRVRLTVNVDIPAAPFCEMDPIGNIRNASGTPLESGLHSLPIEFVATRIPSMRSKD